MSLKTADPRVKLALLLGFSTAGVASRSLDRKSVV